MAEHWVLIIFCLYFAGASAYPAVRRPLSPRPSGNAGRAPRPVGRGKQLFFSQLFLAIMLLALGSLGGWRFEDIGVFDSVAPLKGAAAGVAIYFAFSVALNLVAFAFGVPEQLEDISFEAMRAVWPRERSGKRLAVVGVCLLNPLTEEVMFRGVLMFGLGVLIENTPIAVTVSFVLSLVAHLYQGPKSLISQALFHSLAAGILFSPLGLAGCIGFHFAGDIVPVITFRARMRKWSKRARRPTSRCS